MGRSLLFASMLLAGCDAKLGNDGASADANSADTSQQITTDASLVDAPFVLGAWGTPAAVAGAATAAVEDDPTVSSNKLELYFKRVDVATAPQDHNIYVMKRASVTDAWGAPAAVAALNTTGIEESPRLSADDLTIYFGRAGDIFKSTRASTSAAWGAPVAAAEFNTAAYEKWAFVCGAYGVVSRANGTNGQDLYGGTVGQTFALLTTLNSTSADQGTFITNDCLEMYFQSDRDATFDIWKSTRAAIADPWPAPTKLPDFNTTTNAEEDPWISTDQRMFVFANNASGSKDVYISTR
jgi:hypothetical protein